MCLILLAWRAHPEFPLLFAGNRDEAYQRPSAAADFWQDEPCIFGGRDLEQGGTWLGLTLSGRFAAVTNYRDARAPRNALRSRGELVANFLRGTDAPHAYLERVAPLAADYRGFTLLVGDLNTLFCYSNRGGGIEEVIAGVHGLSNHLLDTPWPKVVHGKECVAALLRAGEAELTTALFGILTDRTAASDADLPDTGVGLQRERELSPAFVAGDSYGTRAATVLLVNRKGEVLFQERAFGAKGVPEGKRTRRFVLQAGVATLHARVAGYE
jgi:uncharacterized protein with NRDE domain